MSRVGIGARAVKQRVVLGEKEKPQTALKNLPSDRLGLQKESSSSEPMFSLLDPKL